MAAVGDVVRAVNSAEPLEILLSRVAEQACRLGGFELCAVMLPDPADDRLLACGSHGLDADYVEDLNRNHALVVHPDSPEEDTLVARAFREFRTLAVPDAARADRYGSTRRLATARGFAALLAAPLPTPAGPAGVIVAYSRTAREFTASEVELIELLAQHSALALETAQLRASQQRTIAELQAKREAQEWAEVQHRRLMQALLDEAGLQALARSLAEALHASITIEDTEDTVLAAAPASHPVPVPGPAARRRRPIRDALRSLGERYEVVSVPPAGADGYHAWVAPVVVGGQLVGRLWGTGLRAAPAPAQCRVIERFALVVAVELLKRRYRIDTENRLAGDLLTELLRSDQQPVPETTAERAKALGHDLTGEQTLAVVTVDGELPDAVRVAAAVRAGLGSTPRPLVGPHEGALVVILPSAPDPVATLSRVHDRVAALIGTTGVTTVLGPAVPVAGGFAAAFAVAAAAAALRRQAGGSGVVDVRELGLPAYLLRTGTTDELRSFVDQLLGPLEEHDRRRGSQLCRTLRTWLDTGCSVPAAATALTVHPNTVSYRLGRVERLLGRDVRRTDTRMELQLALTVRDVQHAATAPLVMEQPGNRPTSLGGYT
jgi:DNA-binding PucR family transcriptional regulator